MAETVHWKYLKFQLQFFFKKFQDNTAVLLRENSGDLISKGRNGIPFLVNLNLTKYLRSVLLLHYPISKVNRPRDISSCLKCFDFDP